MILLQALVLERQSFVNLREPQRGTAGNAGQSHVAIAAYEERLAPGQQVTPWRGDQAEAEMDFHSSP